MVTKEGNLVSRSSMKNARFRAAFDYSPKFSEKPMFTLTHNQPKKIASQEEIAVTEIEYN